MQVWNQVKVKDVDSPHAGRAGTVQQVEPKVGPATDVLVMLDETEELHAQQEHFTPEQLQVLV